MAPTDPKHLIANLVEAIGEVVNNSPAVDCLLQTLKERGCLVDLTADAALNPVTELTNYAPVRFVRLEEYAQRPTADLNVPFKVVVLLAQGT